MPTKEDLIYILIFYGEKYGQVIEKNRILQTIELARKELPELNFSTLELWLQYLGEKFGMQFFISRETIYTAVKTSTPKNPKIAFYSHDHQSDILVLKGKFFTNLKLSSLRQPRKSFYYSISKFHKNSIDSGNEDGLVYWITAEPIHSFSAGLHGHDHYTYLERVKSLVKLESSDIWVIGIYSIAIVILSLVIPIGTQSLVNILAFGTVYQPIIVLTFLVLVALGFAGIMRILQANVAEILQQRLFVRLASEVSEKLPRVHYDYFEKKKAESYINYFLDIATVQKGATILLVDALGVTLQLVIGLLVLVLYHPFFIVFDLLIVVSIFFIVLKVLGKEAITTSVSESKAKHEVIFWFEEVADHRHTFKTEDARRFLHHRLESLVSNYVNYRKKHFSILIKQISVFVGLQVIGSGLLLGFGGWLVINGEISLGQLIAAEIIVSKILDSLAKGGKYLETYYDLCAGLDKIGHLLDIPQERHKIESMPISEKPFHIHVKNLELKTENYKVHIPDLVVNPGELVGLKASSRKEAGSLINILYGLKNPDTGIVEINNRYSLNELSHLSWRKQVSLVRGYKVFNGTIYENVTLGKIGLGTEEVRGVLEDTGLLSEILRLPNGIHTELTSKGAPLTRDQCFLINLSRALIGTPRLVLIDEALDFLNPRFVKTFISKQRELRNTSFLIYSRKEEILSYQDRVVEI